MSIQNRIAGCLFGYAIGDALGLGTEFMTREEIHAHYPLGLRNYSHIIRDAHRSQWEPGEYSNDTVHVLMLAESIIDREGHDYMDFARRLRKWYDDCTQVDMGNHLTWVIGDPHFIADPHETCKRVYEAQHFYEAPNEALGRAMIAGLWPGDVEKNVTDNCIMTHRDSRCVATSVIIGTVADHLLWQRRMPDYDHLSGIAMRLDKRVNPYLEVARNGRLEDLELDDEDTFWYTRKAMAAALWALWHLEDPLQALYEIVDQGGDADTNAALAMGLMGLKYGLTSLPPKAIETMHAPSAERVDDVAKRFADILEKHIPAQISI